MKTSLHTARRLRSARRALATATFAVLAACSSPPTAPPEVEAVPPPAAPPRPGEEMARYRLAAEYAAARSGHVLLILRGEEVVFEAGQNGHAADDPHPLYSASESFWGLMAIAADADGLLDLDEPVALTIPEFATHPWKREIRIRQLLDFTSGLRPGVQALRRDRTANLYERAIALEMVARPGERFQYGPGHLFVFAEVLRRKLEARGADPLDYLEERILDRIGLAVAGWARDDAGNPDVVYGAELTAREWAKLGILLQNRGTWQGRETVAEAAFEAALRPSGTSPEYALTLWHNSAGGDVDGSSSRSPKARAFYPNGLPDLLVAAGVGNQRLYVIPSKGLVVVRFGERDRDWRDHEFLARLIDGAVE